MIEKKIQYHILDCVWLTISMKILQVVTDDLNEYKCEI